MISKFSGINYKAFQKFELELKPLTILLGANSSGKSALINSLLMLSQSSDNSKISESALRLNGRRTGMGETLNIIKDKNPENVLSFSFTLDELEKAREDVSRIKGFCLRTFEDMSRFIGYVSRSSDHAKTATINKHLRSIDLLLSQRDSSGNQQNIAEFSKAFTKLVKAYRANVNPEKKQKHLPPEYISITESASIQKIEDCFNSLLNLHITKLAPTKITYSFTYHKQSETLKVSEFKQHNRSGNIIFGFRKDKGNTTLFSDIIGEAQLNRSKSDILKIINQDSLEPIKSNELRGFGYGTAGVFNTSHNPFASVLSHLVSIGQRHLLTNLSELQINHVSPLRAFPQRYYLLDKSIHHKKLNALEGTELAEVLKNNPKIKHNINLLLAPFNIGIDVEKVNDIIYKIVVNQNAVTLELTDVGFGISQALPILVQAYLSPPKSLTIIEQPEIHLHPNMQAWLTDALISIALSENKKFLIETHSDALIRRIRLRIVDESSKLTENDVKIYNLQRDRNEKCTLLENIEINNNGDIKWPKDFMDVEIKDTIQIQQFKLEKIESHNGASEHE